MRGIEEMLELDLPVAQHSGLGVRPRRTRTGILEHTIPVFTGEIAKRIGTPSVPHTARHRGGHPRPAITGPVLNPVLHEQAGDIAALLLQEQAATDESTPPETPTTIFSLLIPTTHPMCCNCDNGYRQPPRKSAAVRQTSGLRWRGASACNSCGVSHKACTMPSSRRCPRVHRRAPQRRQSEGSGGRRCHRGARAPSTGSADHVGDAHVPAGFLAGLAHRRPRPGFHPVPGAGRLVDHQLAIGAFFHAQQAPVAHHHRGHGHVGLPEAAFAITHRQESAGNWTCPTCGCLVMAAFSPLAQTASMHGRFV